jgi:hypothetical protein
MKCLRQLVLPTMIVIGGSFGFGVPAALGQNPEASGRAYNTARISGDAVVLDGRPSEAAWNQVEWAGGFIQRNPYEGKPPSQETEFKILYDDDALYLAYRAWDNEPDKIRSELARRDWFPGDWVEVNIDSRGDRRTAFSFTTSASGVRGDEYISEDGSNWDSSWDPIWQVATARDERGWTAEVRIPFSQLRYCEKDEQDWGIEVTRRIFRKEERSVWQFIPKDAPGWVSRFGRLRGIKGLKDQKQIELVPYAVAYHERFEKVPGDPFATGTHQEFDGGLDGKIGLSGNMILDFTVNPDFGQIEADPAAVNLGAFETFFPEQRPFFIEGNEVLKYSLAQAVTGGSFTMDRLFYTRRIGRSPHGYPSLAESEHTDVPDETSILGAVKVSGKTMDGLSIGVLDVATAEERARIRGPGGNRRETVEPRTNYFVGRAQQQFRQGRTLLGGMVTAVNRDISDPAVAFLHSSAYAGGIDFEHRWHDRSYRLRMKALGSDVRGSREAVLRTQTSSAHFYQRPDFKNVSVDSTRTSLAGYGGSVYGGKMNGWWRLETGAAWRSPGLEINDIGYMRQAGEINQSTWLGFYRNHPISILRECSLNTNQWAYWDYDGRTLMREFNVNTQATFRNEWNVYLSSTRDLENRSNSLLRGGPSFRSPGGGDFNAGVNSDSRRAVMAGVNAYVSKLGDGAGFGRSGSLDLSYRPTTALRLAAAPSFDLVRDDLQYIGRAAFESQIRYLLATITRETAALTFRADYCLRPSLTIQYYAQPYITSGRYSNFKRVTDPQAVAYQGRFQVFAPGDGPGREIALDAAQGLYEVDENRDGTTDYNFSNPNFNYKAFNSNLVVRWEYHSGSVLYLVWSQGREGTTANGDLAIRDDAKDLFDIHPRNVFLIKASRWFSW